MIKKTILAALLCIIAMGVMAQKEKKGKEQKNVTFSVPIDGHCCIDKITQGLVYEKGVKKVKCNYEQKTVKITYRIDKTNTENLKQTIENLGYKNVRMVQEDKLKKTSDSNGHEGCSHDHPH